MSTRILLEKFEDIDYALVFLTTNNLTPFVCTWAPVYREDGTIDRWGQGHYFSSLINAIAYINDKREEMNGN